MPSGPVFLLSRNRVHPICPASVRPALEFLFYRRENWAAAYVPLAVRRCPHGRMCRGPGCADARCGAILEAVGPVAMAALRHCRRAADAVGLMAPHVGLLVVPAAQIALVQSLTPLLTAILGAALLHESLSSR